MDISTVSQLIASLGFPIVAVIGIAWFIYYLIRKQNDLYDSNIQRIIESEKVREDRYYAQNEKFTDTLNKFNETLIKLDTRLEIIENRLKEDK